MEYQLNNADIETVIDYCIDLNMSESLTVYGFGENLDMVLHIYSDDELENILRIHTWKDGECVDDTEDIYVDSLYKELNRIYNYENFGTI